MLRKIAFVIYAIFCITCLNAQTPRYPVQEFFDDFDDGSFENWKVTNNADNQYFLSNSTYEMYRRSKKTADMIFCNWKNPFVNFEVKLTFKFDKNKNKEQYAGVVLKANSSSAILAEVHQEGKVRIRKISAGKTSFISGSPNESGWIKCNELKKDYNLFAIQCNSNGYTLFLNGDSVYYATIDSFTPGKVGLIIGMNTKIIADNFGVYSAAPLPAMAVNTDSSNYEQSAESTLKSKLENDSTHNTSNKKSVGTKPSHNKTTKPLANSELAAANKKVEELQLQLNLFRNKAYQEQDRADSLQSILDHDGKKEFRAENKTLIAKNKVLERQNDSLVTLMTIYDDLRATMISSEGSEISLLLTEKLRVAKTKQDELEKRNKELELQNKKLNLHIKDLESKVKITPSATKKKK